MKTYLVTENEFEDAYISISAEVEKEFNVSLEEFMLTGNDEEADKYYYIIWDRAAKYLMEEIVDTSLTVAKEYGKRHQTMLRSIRTYVTELEQRGEDPDKYFTRATYTNKKGLEYPIYIMTRLGRDMILDNIGGDISWNYKQEKYAQMEKILSSKTDWRRKS